MMTGALRLVGEPKKDQISGTENMRDLFSKLGAGQERVFWLEIFSSFLMLFFLLKLLLR